MVELGNGAARSWFDLLLRDVVVVGPWYGDVRRSYPREHHAAVSVACAPLDGVRRIVRRRMDRAVHRPSLRRKAAVVFQRHPVFNDRSAVVACVRLSKNANSVLASRVRDVTRSNLEYVAAVEPIAPFRVQPGFSGILQS